MQKNIPFFYAAQLSEKDKTILLDEATSKHLVQVLRMKTGDQLQLTNGKGFLAVAAMSGPNKKSAEVNILSASFYPKNDSRKTGIAISPVKNSSRFEWFLEKATELGVSEIYPLLCSRTEREHFRFDRMNAICISAMLQSQQSWLPVLHQPIAFKDLIAAASGSYQQKWIAHCTDDEKNPLAQSIYPQIKDSLILIGPEGDFTREEIDTALKEDFKPAALGETRLRTETAGVVAAALLQLC